MNDKEKKLLREYMERINVFKCNIKGIRGQRPPNTDNFTKNQWFSLGLVVMNLEEARGRIKMILHKLNQRKGE